MNSSVSDLNGSYTTTTSSSSYHDSSSSVWSSAASEYEADDEELQSKNLQRYTRSTKPFRSMASEVTVGYKSTKKYSPNFGGSSKSTKRGGGGWAKVSSTPIGLTPQQKEKMAQKNNRR